MTWARLVSPAFLLALATLVSAGVGHRAAIHANKIYLKKLPIQAPESRVFHTLPPTAGGWSSVPSQSDRPLSKEVLETLGTENYVSRQYVKRFGDRLVNLELHCAYYTGMVDTVPHVPERCFVGGGMAQMGGSKRLAVPLDVSRFAVDRDADPALHGGAIRMTYDDRGQRVRLPLNIENLTMNVTRFQQQKVDVYAGYFFIANGGTVPRAEDVRFRAFNLTDDYSYYAKVQFTSASVKSEDELVAMAADFLNDMLPEIMRRTPDWVEVTEGRYPADNPRRAGATAPTPTDPAPGPSPR